MMMILLPISDPSTVCQDVVASYLNDMVTHVSDLPGCACLRSASSGVFDMLVMMAQRLARLDWKSGGPRFKSHPRLTYQSWSSYQLNQLGSKAASDSTLKQLTTCGVSNTCTFYFYMTRSRTGYPAPTISSLLHLARVLLHTGAWANAVLLTYLLTCYGNQAVSIAGLRSSLPFEILGMLLT